MKSASVVRGFFILSRTHIIIKFFSIIYVPLLLALLGPAGHGDYALAYVYYGALVALVSEAINKTIIRRVSALQVQNQTAQAIGFTRAARRLSLGIGLVLGLSLALSSPWLADMLHAPQLGLSFIVLAVSLVFVSMTSVYRAYFQASRQMEVAARGMVMEQFFNASCSVGFSWLLLRYGPEISLAGAASGSLFGALASCLYMHWHFSRDANGPTEYVPVTLVYRLVRPLLGLSLIYQLILMAEAWVLKQRLAGLGLNAHLASVAYSDISSYKMAQSIPMILVSALATALYPAITESITQSEHTNFWHRITQAIRHNYIISLPAVFGIALVAQELTVFAFDGRAQRATLIMAGAFMLIPMGIALIQQVILQSEGRLMVSQWPLLISISVQLIGNYVWIRPPIGIMGAILSGYFSWISMTWVNEYLLRRRRVKLDYWKPLIKPMLASLIMSGAVLAVKLLLPLAQTRLQGLGQLLLLAGWGMLCYGISLIWLGGFTRQDVISLLPGVYSKLPTWLQHQLK